MLVADSTCQALLKYARALADAGKTAIAKVPVLSDSGGRALAHVLIGPASELFSQPVSGPEVADPAAVAELERLTANLEPAHPAFPTDMPETANFEFYDWDFEPPHEP